jgi:hypothetical protein
MELVKNGKLHNFQMVKTSQNWYWYSKKNSHHFFEARYELPGIFKISFRSRHFIS